MLDEKYKTAGWKRVFISKFILGIAIQNQLITLLLATCQEDVSVVQEAHKVPAIHT